VVTRITAPESQKRHSSDDQRWTKRWVSSFCLKAFTESVVAQGWWPAVPCCGST